MTYKALPVSQSGLYGPPARIEGDFGRKSWRDERPAGAAGRWKAVGPSMPAISIFPYII
jgi:hypothetical protein